MRSLSFDILRFIHTHGTAGLRPAEVLDGPELVNRRDLRELEYRMTIKLGGLMVAAVGIVATLVKLL